MAETGVITETEILQDFERAFLFKKPWLAAAKTDFEYRMGKQWKPADVAKLDAQGRPALTINRIHTIINLVYGIESQNRTDPKAYPEGLEDDVKGEIATRLLKNMSKKSWLGFHMSEQFEHGNIAGECYLEPWLDYTKDLLYGEFRVTRLQYNQGFPDPDATEYDLSDAEYFDKISYDLTKDKLVSLFPKKEADITRILGDSNGRIKFDAMNASSSGFTQDNPNTDYVKALFWAGADTNRKATGDLLEHYYKKYVPVYYVIDKRLRKVQRTDDKVKADNYKMAFDDERMKTKDAPDAPAGEEWVQIEERTQPEIWVAALLGGEIIDNRRAPSFPRWKGFPFMPYFCYKMDVPVDEDDRALLRQGFVRPLKDPQTEHNKRESQLLHHLNTTVGGGALEYETGTLENEEEVKMYGAGSGSRIIRKKNTPEVKRHPPAQLSEGHLVMSERHADSIKVISGIDTEFLAQQQGKDLSGRAIALRQKHGLLMVQKPFDHWGRTKVLTYGYMLSVLPEVYDVDRAMKVLGAAFLNTTFSKPKMIQVPGGPGGAPVMQPALNPDGSSIFELDVALAQATISEVLNDPDLADYDMAIGETAMSDTTQMSNFLTMQDMQESGIPVPPEVLIEESGLSPSAKKKIVAAIQAQQAAMAAQARGPQPGGPK